MSETMITCCQAQEEHCCEIMQRAYMVLHVLMLICVDQVCGQEIGLSIYCTPA